MKIGISGASGQLGRKTVEVLSSRPGSHQIVALSRTPGADARNVESRFCDYDRPDSLASAYAGLDRLLIIPSADLRPGIRGPQLVGAIDAAIAAGVKHILLLSMAGTRAFAEPALGATYWAAEQHLIRAAPAWTILRMNFYAESFADEVKASLGFGVLTGLGRQCTAYVSRDDVAAAAAGLLLDDGHAGAIYNATGPEALSGEDAAAIVSEIVGRQIGFIAIAEDQLRAGFAEAQLPDFVIEALIDIKQAMVEGGFDIVTHDVERLSGKAATPLRDVLVQALG